MASVPPAPKVARLVQTANVQSAWMDTNFLTIAVFPAVERNVHGAVLPAQPAILACVLHARKVIK